jgi:hypothetical protein
MFIIPSTIYFHISRSCLLYDEFYLLDIMPCSPFSQETFRRNMLPPYSASKNKPSKKLASSLECKRDGKNKGHTTNLRNRICVGYIERISVGNTEYPSSVYLYFVVIVKMH